MKYLKTFNESVSNEYYSAGIVFVYDDKILLVHPTNRSAPDEPIDDDDYIWSYPKGKVDDGEDLKMAAIREIGEELSISLPDNFLDNINMEEAYVGIKHDPLPEFRGLKHYVYFTYYLNDVEFEKYFNSELTIPKNKLQLWEVDAAQFFDRKTAKIKCAEKISKILNY